MTIEEMKARKRELGYTNEMIAAKSGVPLGTVQKIFSGETRSPRLGTVQKLEKVLLGREHNKNAAEYSPYTGMIVSEPSSVGTYDFYTHHKSEEKNYKKVHNADYSPVPIKNRIGIAAGKFRVPDDAFFYDDEIADMFEDF